MATSKKSTKKTSQPIENTKSEKSEKKTMKHKKVQQFDKTEQDTQLVNIKEFEKDRIIFADPLKIDVSGGKMYRIKLYYRYKDGKVGPILVPLTKKYCYGVQPNNVDSKGNVWVDKETGKPKDLTGYKMPLVMLSKEPKPEEKEEIEFIDSLQEFLSEWCLQNKDKFGKSSKKDEQIKGMITEMLYRKDDKAPIYYTTLIYYSKKRVVDTKFYGPGDEELDPLSVTGHCYSEPNVWINEITVVGRGISFGSKIYDAAVEPISRAPKKRLAPSNKMSKESNQDFSKKDESDGEKKIKSKSKPEPESASESE